jgi:hypothetical protein
MAIDTAAKRRAALEFGLPGLSLPDGGVGVDDRITLNGGYYFTAEVEVVLPVDQTYTVRPRPRLRTVRPKRSLVMEHYDPTTPDGVLPLSVDTIDLLKKMPPGTILSAASVVCEVHPDSEVVDPAAGTRIGGGHQTGNLYTVTFQGGVDKCIYVITFKLQFSSGQVEPVEATLPVGKFQ